MIPIVAAFFSQLTPSGMPAMPLLLFFFLLGSILFLISFIKTDIALIILIFSMLLSPEFFLGGIPGRSVVVRFDDIMLAVVFFGWVAKMAVHKEIGLLRSSMLTLPIITYIMCCIISSVLGIIQGTTNPAYSIFYIIKYIEYFLLFFMVMNNIKDIKQVQRLVFCILLSALIIDVYALRSSFVYQMRATAPFEGKSGEANTLAGYLIIILSMSFSLVLYSRHFIKKIVLLGFFSFTLFVFIYTQSRSGLLGFFAMYTTIILLYPRYRIIFLSLFLGGLLISSMTLPEEVLYRFKTVFTGRDTYMVFGVPITVDESIAIRIWALKASIIRWTAHPFFGEGVPGTGIISDVQYGRVLREVGLFGFFAFFWMIMILFKAGLRNFRDAQVDNFGKALSIGFIACLAGILLMGVGAEVFIIVRIMEPFWFLTAIIIMIPHVSQAQPDHGAAKETVK